MLARDARLKWLAGLIGALAILQALAGAALAAASPSTAPDSPPIIPSGTPAASPASLAPTAEVSAPADVQASTPLDAAEKLAASTAFAPRMPFTWQEAAHNNGAIAPLSDTDNNDINMARWLNGSYSWTGESVNGQGIGGGGRVDVDWWKFPLANYSLSSSDVMEFDVEKQAGEHMWVIVYAFPSFDPDNYAQGTSAHTVFYDYMNSSQGWGAGTHVKITGFEDSAYFLLLISPRRMSCCLVNYSIYNVTDYTVTGDTSIDDNSNRSTAAVFNTAPMPSNQEVEQNNDYVDVFDLTAQFGITPSAGDYSQITVSVTVAAGRSGISDFWNTTQTPDVISEGNTLSYAAFWIFYPDPRGYYHTLPAVNAIGLPGDTLTVSALINGTPVYAAVMVNSFINIPGINPQSSVPGWVRYNFTAFSHLDDRAPRLATSIPGASMFEDNVSSGTNLYDLSLYFTDDRDQGFLWFSTNYNQFPANVATGVSGNYLSVSTITPDWWGNLSIQVLAHDLGMDRTAGTPDDAAIHSTASNYFVVNIQPTNDPPSITAIGGKANVGAELAFGVMQGGTLTLTPTATDPDGMAGSSFSLAPTPAFATFYPSNGTMVLSPGNADVGDHHLVETITDFGGATARVLLVVTVNNTNDEPRFAKVGGFNVSAMPANFQATQGQPFALVLEVADADWDIGVRDPISFASDKNFMNLTQDPFDKRVVTARFTPTNAQVGPMAVRFSVSDGAIGAFDDNITVNIVVLNTNDPPTLVSVGTVLGVYNVGPTKEVSLTGFDGARQNTEFVMTIRADDPDVAANLGDSLSFSTDLGPKFKVTLNPDGRSADIAFTPNQTDASRGRVTVLITVHDAGVPQYSDTFTLNIDVANVNDPPVFDPVFAVNLTEDEEFLFAFVATDPDGDPVSYSSDSSLFAVDSTTGTVDLTPTNDMIGGEDIRFDVTVTARDNHSGVTTMVVHVFISNTNDAPSGVHIQAPLPGSSFGPGETVTFRGAGVDVDRDDQGALNFTWFADDAEIGTGVTLAHAFANPSPSPVTITITLRVSDTHGASRNDTTAVTVNGTPKPSPGFDASLVVVGALAAAALVIALGRRRA